MKRDKKDLIMFVFTLFFGIFIMSLITKCNAQEIGKDKYYHFYYGSFASGLSTVLYLNSNPQATLKSKITLAVGSAFALGLAKELYDTRKGGSGFSVADLTATTLGALPITIIIKLTNNNIYGKVKPRRNNRENF